jgi:hypothetical protein
MDMACYGYSFAQISVALVGMKMGYDMVDAAEELL